MYNFFMEGFMDKLTKEEVLQAVKDVLYPFIKEHMG